MGDGTQSKKLSPFFAYPNKARFNRPITKNKIYEHSAASKILKDQFVRQVEQIIWEYKLAPETINLVAKGHVHEIQIFSIRLKSDKLDLKVLRCIDEVIFSPIIFELHRGEDENTETQVVAAYKNQTSSGGLEMSNYFCSEWISSDVEREPIPLSLDMKSLYEQIICLLIPIPSRAHESIDELLVRFDQFATKRQEIERIAVKLAKEKQFNRKVEINARLRELKSELEKLI